jgi:hypothetical protein
MADHDVADCQKGEGIDSRSIVLRLDERSKQLNKATFARLGKDLPESRLRGRLSRPRRTLVDGQTATGLPRSSGLSRCSTDA